MKVFIGQKNACGLNYQRDVISVEMINNFEIVDDVREVDIIIIPDTCCCTEYHTKYTVCYINKVLEDKKDDAIIIATLGSNGDSARLYVSNGCRNNCSFCKVIFQDYPLKSVELPLLKEAVDYLDEKGFKTVSIKGTNAS